MKNLTICDMHCDTLTTAYDLNKSIFLNNLNVDIKRLKKYKSYTQFFAVFISPKYYSSPQKRCFEVINYMYNQFLKYSNEINLCKSINDINKISAFLSIEGGEAIQTIDDLKVFYDMGVRMLTLTWNFDNHIAGANGSEKGLSEFGRMLVTEMNELGMIIDLSHASENTFFDTLKITTKPIVLSHSNSYTLCPHSRNVTDTQFMELIKNNGCIGINFYPDFLNETKKADIYDIVSHIEYFLSLGGENNISIGSDFDGTDTLADGISSVRDIDKIFNILSSKGISDEIIKKIAYKNIYRVISICL